MDYEQMLKAAPLALSIVAMLGQAVAWLRAGRKASADAASVLTSSAVTMVNELQEELKLARAEIVRLRAENERLRDGKRPYTPPRTNGDD